MMNKGADLLRAFSGLKVLTGKMRIIALYTIVRRAGNTSQINGVAIEGVLIAAAYLIGGESRPD